MVFFFRETINPTKNVALSGVSILPVDNFITLQKIWEFNLSLSLFHVNPLHLQGYNLFV